MALHIGQRRIDARLGGPHCNVSVGHLGVQRHQDVAIVLDGGLKAGIGRFDRPRDPSPHVDFPLGAQPSGVERAGPAAADHVVRLNLFADPAVVDISDAVDSRQRLAGCEAHIGSGLQNARHGLFCIEVAGRGPLNEIVENRIVECGPPSPQIGFAFLQAL